LGKETNAEVVWEYVTQKIKSEKPFIKRAMIVLLFSYFNKDTYIDQILWIFQTIKDENYYVKMALAWSLSVFAIKNFDRIIKILQDRRMDKFIHNKTIQKCQESYRITKDQKEILRKLRI
jgi:3-methyladenine DNA glycosylase AlkD